jgi:AcrR family transcriptional regulator
MAQPTGQFMISSVPRISQARRAERRSDLLMAAWRCAARKGYRDTTVDDICAEAGVSKGAFYGYFESKQDLLLGLLEDDARAVDEVLDELDREPLGCRDRLSRFSRAMLERGEDPAHVQVRVDLWSAMTTTGSVRERFTQATERRRQILRRWIEEGIRSGEIVEVPSNALASLLLAAADGLLLHNGLQPSAFKWFNIRKALDVLLDGLTADAPSATGGPSPP